MNRVYASFALFFFCFCNAAKAESNDFVLKGIAGNWFSNNSEDKWQLGIYYRLFFFKKEFWHYEVIGAKDDFYKIKLTRSADTCFIDLKLMADSSLVLSKANEAYKFSKKRSGPVSNFTQKDLVYNENGKIHIKGIIDHAYLLDRREDLKFSILDHIYGKWDTRYSAVDSNGLFSIDIALEAPSFCANLNYGPIREKLILNPGDTVIIYLDILEGLLSKSTNVYDRIGSSMVVSGKVGDLNNEFYLFNESFPNAEFYLEANKVAGLETERKYFNFLIESYRKDNQNLKEYSDKNKISRFARDILESENYFRLLNWLYRYRWLHKQPDDTNLSLEYTRSIDSIAMASDKYMFGGYEFVGFKNELVNRFYPFLGSDNLHVKSYLNSRISFADLMNFMKMKVRSIPVEMVQVIDSVSKLPFVLKFTSNGVSIAMDNIPDTSTAHRIKELAGPVFQYMDSLGIKGYYICKFELDYTIKFMDSAILSRRLRNFVLPQLLASKFLNYDRLLIDEDIITRVEAAVSNVAIARSLDLQMRKSGMRAESNSMENLLATNVDKPTFLNQLASENKGKVIYVDIWATWCGPCFQQFPFSESVQKRLKEEDVVFAYLCVSSTKEDWYKAVDRAGLTGQQYFLDRTQYQRLQEKYQIQSIPKYFMIAPNGDLLSTNAIVPEQEEALYSIIKNILNNAR